MKERLCIGVGPYFLSASICFAVPYPLFSLTKTLAPAKDFYVLLYHDGADSLPLTTLPDYVSKSLADGSFLLKNIAPGDYKIFALKDVNSNVLFDLPNEEIAFQEELVTAVRALPDTAADSLKAELPLVALHAFAGEDTVQVLARYDNPAAGVYKVPYKHRFVDVTATPLDRSLDYFEQINATRDTVTWYLRAPLKDRQNLTLTFAAIYARPA